MYPETFFPETKQILDKIKKIALIKNFYLAGGTGLALQIGHRKSVDLDFFTSDFPKRDLLLSSLKKFKPKILQEALNTLDLEIAKVKVSFLEYKYPTLEELRDFQGIKIAGIADIACMKISAISSRGSKKDFIDFYFILKNYDLSKLLNLFEKKFGEIKYQKLHVLKSLIYFEDADKEPEPILIQKVDWESVKESLRQEVSNLFK